MSSRDDLRSMLDSYAEDMKALIKIGPKQFEIAEVAHMIYSVPPRKWKAAQGVVDATVLKRDAEQKLRVAKAKHMLIAKNRDDLKASPDRVAWVDNQSTVMEAEIELINADAELLSAKLAYECLDDLFSAGKRIMQYLIEQGKATDEFNRFSNDARRNS